MINFKHLYYFWMVAKEGGITRASERLHLTPQTISGQLSLLEEQLGEALLTRVGRRLELTETGRLAASYADEIFSLGAELEEQLRDLPSKRTTTFKVGIVDVVPKSIAYRLLVPALQMSEQIRIVCREGSINDLLAALAVHRLDLVLADSPIPASVNVRGFNHPLGECRINFFAHPDLAKAIGPDFPHNLSGAPILLPGDMNAMRSRLQQWLDRQHIHPKIIGEFDDSALMKAFGGAGTGVFTAPAPIAAEVEAQYGVVTIGQTDELRDQFYAISMERKVSHPAVSRITEAAQEWLTQKSMRQTRRRQGNKP